MLKKITASLLACAVLALAPTAEAQQNEHEFGIGFGTEFGGLYGLQYAYRVDDSRYKLGLGVIGVSARSVFPLIA